MRKATISRETKETRITVSVALDGGGRASVNTGSACPRPFASSIAVMPKA